MVSPRQGMLALLVVVGLTACSATGRVDCEGHFVYNPDTFTTEQKEWIENSSVRWNDWAGHQVIWVKPGYNDICSIDPGPTEKESAIGQITYRLQNIRVDVEDLRKRGHLNRRHFEGVVMHEMGHSLGYRHTPEGTVALMATAGGPDFTEVDRLECIKHGMCQTLLASNQAE